MKKFTLFLTLLFLLALSASAMAGNRVQSGEIIVDLENPDPSSSFSISQSSAIDGEVLENPGFETGDIAPWYSNAWNVTTSNPHSGLFCATDEGNYWIRQDFPGIPVEEIVSITFWSRQPEEAIQAIDLMYSDGTYFEDLIWPGMSWGFFDITSWLAPGKTLEGIRFWGYSGGGPDPDITFIDDISIEQAGQEALEVDPPHVSAYFGGTLTFTLFNEDLAGHDYALFGTLTGTSPGTPWPNGLTLPVNWDWFTDFLLALALGNHPLLVDFIGTLDADGYATAEMIFPGHCQLYDDLTANFAWSSIYPFDFVSNSVEAEILGVPDLPEAYFYDDGTAEVGLGLAAGGHLCWMHWFQTTPGAMPIKEIHTAFGSSAGANPPAGNPASVYIWDDPNGDGDPSDAVLLAQVATVCTDPGTNIFQEVNIGTVPLPSAGFFIGAMCEHDSGTYPGPVDEDTPYMGEAWAVGDTGYNFDPVDLYTNDVPPVEMSSIGIDGYFLLRACINN